MIVAIEGVVSKKEPSFCIIKTACGVSYQIITSLNCSVNIQKGDKIELMTTYIVREDANLLYGFLDIKEKQMFETLIKLSGIGPSTAIAICSSILPDDFLSAIITNQISVLTKIPGIGPKTAKRMIVELGDAKFLFNQAPTYQNEAMLALESLGFKKEKIRKVILECKSTTTQELIKEALKKLG